MIHLLSALQGSFGRWRPENDKRVLSERPLRSFRITNMREIQVRARGFRM
jgi:hypothetical protein